MKFVSKIIYVSILLFFQVDAAAQRFYSVVFDQLPKNMQLYARNDSSLAAIPISGNIEVAGWNYCSVVTYRNQKRVSYLKSNLDYAGKSSAHFDLHPTIKAELADYDFEVYAVKDADSILVVKRTDVVAGDFYMISGQSNGSALKFSDHSSKYWRTVGRTPDENPGYGPADTLWIQSAWSWPYVGAWGLEIQKRASENYGIPTCVINGAVPGSRIGEHSSGDTNPNSLYGILLHRVRKSGATRVRTFFWLQGEQEALEDISGYDASFDRLFNFWQRDYPMADQFLVAQTNMLFGARAGEIRDFQRRTKYIYPKTEHFASIGLPGYDGVHYNLDGYREYGHRLFDLLAPKIYGSNDTLNVKSPDTRKVFYSDEGKREITLVYEPGQVMEWPADTTVTGKDGKALLLSLKDFFYPDGDESKPVVASAKIADNRVILTLKGSSSADELSYMPSFLPTNFPVMDPPSDNLGWFKGPFLKNARGLGAFTFDKVKIYDLLKLNAFTAKQTAGMVDLTWQQVVNATTLIIERKEENGAFTRLAEEEGAAVKFVDQTVRVGKLYTYRIKASNVNTESSFFEAEIKVEPILGVEPQREDDLMVIFPNPVTDLIHLQFKRPATGVLKIVNSLGQTLFSQNIASELSYSINVPQLPSGIYVLTLKGKTGLFSSQKFVK